VSGARTALSAFVEVQALACSSARFRPKAAMPANIQTCRYEWCVVN
jgi:hypothetical protein